MNKKRAALLKSAIAMLLCLSMLVGTTFAWFTDSVTTGINTIAAGVLDVELYHSNAAVTDEQVDSATKLFLDLQGDPIAWEPGVVSYENLRIANEGDLALVYQLAMNTANENFVVDPSGARYGLSQVLKVGVVEGGITATDRAGVLASVKTTDWTTLANFLRNGSLLPEGEGESENTWGIVIYWEPGANDNFWNLNNGKTLSQGEVLSIDLGIRLVATQEQHESDSFGKDYDVDAMAAVFPNFAGGSATATVVPNDQGQTSAAVTMTSGQVSASVPAGVQLAQGANALTLKVSVMGASGANITLGENEDMRSLDVHIEGVAAENTAPITVVLKEAAPKGLNMGNYKLFHVEANGTNEMTLVDAAADFTAHNQFKYDPVTGDLTLYMATFSEVSVVANTINPWQGNRDYSWYDASATALTIVNADQLAGFGAIVGGMDGQTADDFAGKTVKLIANINIGDVDSENGMMFYPIGYYNTHGGYTRVENVEVTSGFKPFKGTFDGNGNTIANFYQNTWETFGDYNDGYEGKPNYCRDGFGLFGKIYGGTVKNLTVKSFSSDGEFTTTGTIAAYAEGATFENIAIFDCNPRVYNIGNGGIVGCVGWYATEAGLKTTFKNITVDNTNKISALWGSWDVACGGLVGQYYPTSGQEGSPANGGIHMENCHVAAQIDVYNDVCANYQYYAYRYAGILIGSVRENVEQNGHVYPKMDGITASGCTVHFGDWNDYYYCELVANTTASYTHDHQMSRLTQVKSVDVTNKKVVTLDDKTVDIPASGRVNYVVVKAQDANGKWIHGDGAGYATCYHFVNGAVWNHADAGYHDGENGEKFIDENGDGQADLKEDKQIVYREFNNLVTGYGWGVTSKGIGELAGVTILDREEGNSVTKFKSVAGIIYKSGTEVKIGDLFKYIEDCGVPLDADNIQVTVSPATEKGTAGCKYVANTADWTQGTLTFTGLGDAIVTITDYHFCKETTIMINIYDQFNSIKANAVDNYYNVGHTFTVDDFAVIAVATSGVATAITEGYTVDTSGINTNTPGTYTATITFVNTADNETFTADCTVKVANLTERDDYEVTLLGKPLHIYIGADRLDEYPTGGTHTTANGEEISGLDSSNYQAFDFTVNNAVRSTRLAFNAPFVTDNAPVRGFGYYIDGKVGSLVTTDSFVDGNNGGFNSGHTYGGHVDTSHMIPMYCNNFAAGTTHTVHWVVVFDEGIKTVGTWTVNMKESVGNDEAFEDTDKPNANVIILAGQSNAFGITPLTQAVKNQYAGTDFTNVFIRYNNVYFADGTGASANLSSWYSNTAFEEYAVGKGVYGDGSRSCFGPELGIAAALVNDHPGEQWYIIKYTMPSSGLATNWMGGGFTVNGKDTNMMNDMLSFIEESIDMLDESYDVNIKGFAWMQGESDATNEVWANAYAANEQMLIETIRTKFAAYATRTASASDVPGSGIAFLNAGIASYDYVDGMVVTSQWTYENAINTAKVNNSEYIFSAFKGYGATDLLGSGVTFPQASHLESYTIGSNLWIQNPESANISNSMFIDTVGFHTKATITKDHTDAAYTDEDRADHAHYAPDYMTYLGQWFVNCMDLLHQQNG